MKSLYRLKPAHVLFALIAVHLILTFLIGNEYGQAWDEPSFYLFGERSFDAYLRGLAGLPLIPEKHIFFLDLRYYGAFYTAIGWEIVNALQPVLNNWGYVDVWHFVNFIFFQIALISLYVLAKRYVNPWTAVLVVFLFYTQPLLFGHAFINPKDVPFLSFFLASVTVGLLMADAIKKNEPKNNDLAGKSFSTFNLLLAALFGLFIFTFIGKDLVSSAIGWVVSAIYNSPSDSFFGKFFSVLAGNSNRLPVESYIHKAVAAHLERKFIYPLFFILMGWKFLADYSRNNNINIRFRSDFRLWGLVLGAGILLGLTTSIRLLAPLAGLLVAGYALWAKKRNSLPALIYYFSIAAVISYLTWPFLWNSPFYNFLEAFQVMRDFPYNAEVRFMGDNIQPSNLPWYFVPFLISVQITEPMVILAWIGFIIFLSRMGDRNSFIPLVWLIFPVGLQILLKSNVYDNFRQFLFVLPPMFILAGVGFESLIKRVTNQVWKILFIVICVAPGLIGVVSLHPYQYIYYNSFVGGVSGAEGKFELDYWLTSYHEAGAFINGVASPDANILAWGSGYNGARKDLTVFAFGSEDEIENSGEIFEYAVITSRYAMHQDILQDAEVVYEVRKNGALLAVVKKMTK